ncbi:MAG: hypothetical protein H7Z41_11270, partial [Cytophagales bacterium]|nr:hypothetical protein [Armatimonadota bacterium]
MSRWQGVLKAAAPVTALVVLAVGARMLPSALGKNDAAEEETPPSVVAPPKRAPSASKPPKRKAAPGPRIADAKTQAALQKVVQGQLAAFAKDDFAAALRYSAPDFRRTWSPES